MKKILLTSAGFENKNIENKIKEMKKSAPIKIQVNPNMFPRS